jgi:hypothetical protein
MFRYELRADACLARELLGFSGEINIEAGLKRYVDCFRAPYKTRTAARIRNQELGNAGRSGGGVIAFRSPADFVTSGPGSMTCAS